MMNGVSCRSSVCTRLRLISFVACLCSIALHVFDGSTSNARSLSIDNKQRRVHDQRLLMRSSVFFSVCRPRFIQKPPATLPLNFLQFIQLVFFLSLLRSDLYYQRMFPKRKASSQSLSCAFLSMSFCVALIGSSSQICSVHTHTPFLSYRCEVSMHHVNSSLGFLGVYSVISFFLNI